MKAKGLSLVGRFWGPEGPNGCCHGVEPQKVFFWSKVKRRDLDRDRPSIRGRLALGVAALVLLREFGLGICKGNNIFDSPNIK